MTTNPRLGYLRDQIRAECISYGEIAELQDLRGLIDPGDVELLAWATGAAEDEDNPFEEALEAIRGARCILAETWTPGDGYSQARALEALDQALSYLDTKAAQS